MIVYVLMLCSFAVATAEFVLVGLLSEVAADLSVSLPAAGFLVTAYMVVVTVGGPVAAVLTRRLPRRGLLAATMAIALLSAAGSAAAGSYGTLLAARLGSALAQALFMAVASQVAMAAVPPERQTAAVAKVFNGFALATVIGLPLGTLVGQAYGWRATFVLVTALAAAGLAGVLLVAPAVPHDAGGTVRGNVTAVLRAPVLLGLLVTGFALTGFVAAFTYVAPVLREVTGLGPAAVSAALVVYGLGTIAGNLLAGRVRPARILPVLPAPLGALAVVLLAQGVLLRHPVAAVLSLFALGASAFAVVPLVQTWLMGEVGPGAAGLVAAVNISVAGLAGALGAALGAAVIGTGLGLPAISPIAALPTLAALLTAALLRTARPRDQGIGATPPGVSRHQSLDHASGGEG
ncbi:MAG TPA: MFS transporter [Pilimelia sp.]|nr:MFS transporter [Pilimelia sp.]